MFKHLALVVVILGTMLFGCAPKDKDISVKTVGATKCVFIAGQGNYSEIGPTFSKLFEWLGEKDIEPVGPPFGIYNRGMRIGISFLQLIGFRKKVPPKECKYEIYVPIKAEIEGDSLVQTKEIPEMEVASLIYKGPYDKVGASWKKLYVWIHRNKYEPAGPGMEIYLNSPDEVPEDSLLTEIQVPVKKK